MCVGTTHLEGGVNVRGHPIPSPYLLPFVFPSPRSPLDSLLSSLPHPYFLIFLPFLPLSLVYLSPCSPTHPNSRDHPQHCPIRSRLTGPCRDSPIPIATLLNQSQLIAAYYI